MVSGGQTGADRAGLEAARSLGIQTGGWAPPGYQTSAGKDLSLASFGLKELPSLGMKQFLLHSRTPGLPSRQSIAALYVQRSIKNVDDSDATIAFLLGDSVGTLKTIQYCASGKWGGLAVEGQEPHRPCLVLSTLRDEDRVHNIKKIREFIKNINIRILNVAGHRDPPPTCPDFSVRVKSLLQEAWKPYC